MNDILAWLSDPSGLTQHGLRLLWDPGLIWTSGVADVATGLGYFSVLLLLSQIARQRHDLVFKPAFWIFPAFALLCGAGYWLDLVTLWVPANETQAGVKTATAVASILTAATLWPLLRRTLALPSPGQTGMANAALEKLAADRGRAVDALRHSQAALRRMNVALRARVADRTATLLQVEEALHTEARERERAEAALYQSRKMEAVGRLTAGVAHDFSNLLQAMMGGLELLQDRAGADPASDRMLAMSIDAAQHGARLTRHLLAFSCQQVLRPSEIDITPLLRRTAAMLERMLGPGIVIRTGEDNTGLHAFADSAQLECCILNLALNARDAMPHRGTLTIGAYLAQVDRSVSSEALPPGEYVVLAVQDTGERADGATPDGLFGPSFTSCGDESGAGLGLGMVLAFARQSGGDVRITRAPGEGTRVEVFLPFAGYGGPLAVPAIEQTPPPCRAVGHILVVDDVPDVLVTLGAFLQGGGFEVTKARSADDALRIVASPLELSAIVTDYAMPGMSGAELIRQVAQMRPTLPSLVVTGYPGVEGLNELPERVPVLHKPFPRAALLEQVLILLDRNGSGSPTHCDFHSSNDVVQEIPTAANEEPLCRAVLHAIADIARHNSRRQTEVGAALYRGGILLEVQERAKVLDRLSDAGLIEQIILLSDGGIFVTVTLDGLRAGLT
jgi:signal transduction histidine kinase/CheY-like chemotaxis protein